MAIVASSGPGWKQEHGTPLESLVCVTEAQAFSLQLAALSGKLAGCWVTGTHRHSDIRCWHHKQWLNPACLSAALPMYILNNKMLNTYLSLIHYTLNFFKALVIYSKGAKAERSSAPLVHLPSGCSSRGRTRPKPEQGASSPSAWLAGGHTLGPPSVAFYYS